MKKIVQIYWFAAVATVAIWFLVGWQLGSQALFTVFVLTLLEVTFSADNAVINSRVVITLSPLWQKLFLTIGIFTAVFLVRFFLPLLIVMISSSISWNEVVYLITADHAGYAEHLHQAEPIISTFGGIFLLMIALSYFIDDSKTLHWFGPVERRLAALGRYSELPTFILLALILVIFLTTDHASQAVVLAAAVLALLLHIGLDLVSTIMKNRRNPVDSGKPLVGLAALSGFIYLEVLDASFSLDGVIGAFAMTNEVFLIMAGLGAGALWVRGITIHLVSNDILKNFVFLEHGAHWAIAFLGCVMISKLYGIDLPEWLIGSLGLVLIALAIIWSLKSKRAK